MPLLSMLGPRAAHGTSAGRSPLWRLIMVIEKDLVEDVAVKVAVAEPPEALPEATCKHHWVIEAANGPISRGECQVCHEGKEFKNSITDANRDY